MPVTVITTIGAANANSYISVVEADTYFEGHLYASQWASATTDTKSAALVYATRTLDNKITWNGSKVDQVYGNQALQWPRASAYTQDGIYVPSDIIPVEVKNATAELALNLIKNDLLNQDTGDTLGITEIKVDVINLKFDSSIKKAVIPKDVIDNLNGLGIVRGSFIRVIRG